MKKAKALLAFLLVAVMLLNAMPVGAVGTATFEVQTAQAKAGENVDVTISVKNSPGITSTKLTVTFGDALSLTNVTYGTQITGNFVKPKNMTSPIILNWANGLEDFSGDYVFATLTFQVAADAEEGLCPITVTYDPDDVYNVDEANADFAIQNGGVQIEVPPVSVAGVSLDKSALSLKTGETETLIATISPDKATNKDVSWESSDNTVATVDNNGKVVALQEGAATVTVTTMDGSFSASCVVSVACSHINKTETPSKSPDCVNPGNNKYYTCDACGDVFKADGVTESTVKDETILALDHDFTERIEDAVHLVSGTGADCQHMKEYYFDCSRCDVIGTTTFTGNTAGEHQVESVWTVNDGKHYHKCAVADCTYIEDEASCDGGTATCTEKAVCSVCENEYGELLDHDLTHYAPNDADHTKPGNIEYWQCEDCEKYFSDASANNEITQADTVIAQIPHSHSTSWSENDTQHWNECACGDKINVYDHHYDNTCDTTCNTCGHIRTITHTWMTTLSYNADQHWIECDICHEKKEVEDHHGGTATCLEKATCDGCGQAYGELSGCDFTAEKAEDKYLVSAATCKDAAVYHKSCTVCGAVGTDTFITVKNPENHVGGTEIRNASAESCTVDGYTGDTHCKGCGELLITGRAIPATAHNTAIAVAEIASTCKVQGTKAHFHCDVCDKDFLEKTAAAVAQTADDLKLPLNAENHEGGTEKKDAAPATCEVPGYTGDTYCKGCTAKVATGTIIPAEHKLDEVAANPATHEAAGNIGHYACFVCGELYDDDKATTQLTEAEVVIPKGEHRYSETFQYDEHSHWKSCECGSMIEEDEHTYGDWVITKESAVGVQGSKERGCATCEYKETEKLPALSTPDTGDDMLLGVLLIMLTASLLGMCAVIYLLFQKNGKYQR